MSALATELVLILLLIVINGVFSGSEIAVVSARKVRLEQLASRGNAQARMALRLANAPNDFLSTVQIGITLISILNGAVGGATIAQRLQPVFEGIPSLAPYSEGLSVAIVVSIITYLSLVIGELVPKRLALNNPEKLACSVAQPMRTLARVTAPFVRLLGVSTDALLALMNVQASDEPTMTEEEIKVMIRQGAESGVLETSEQEMVERVFRLGDRPIRAIMTPRTEIVWLDLDSPWEEHLNDLIDSGYSRFPVAKDSLDECIGIVRGSSLLAARLRGQDFTLEHMMQPPLYVAESTRVLNVLEMVKKSGIHMALVVDEYGGIEGLVTLTDLMEAIVGELPSAEDPDGPMVVQREDGSWLLDGLLSIDEFNTIFGQAKSLEVEMGSYTIAGFVVSSLKKIPQAGEHFEWNGLRFEVVDMDGIRVDKVLVTAL
jgi:putative hemolysin